MMAAKISFRTENGVVENLKISPRPGEVFGYLMSLFMLSSTGINKRNQTSFHKIKNVATFQGTKK